jgi:hypothetical protein
MTLSILILTYTTFKVNTFHCITAGTATEVLYFTLHITNFVLLFFPKLRCGTNSRVINLCYSYKGL